MKTTLYPLLMGLLLLGATACEEESATPETQPEFFVKAQKAGQAWTVPGSGVYVRTTKKFHVYGNQNQANMPEAYLRLDFEAPTQGTTVAAQAEWLELVGGDVIVDNYSTTGVAEPSSVEVTRLDTVQRVLEGRFQTTLRRDQRWSTRGELLPFSNGSFRIRYTVVQ
ncbi:hypothetical protein [Hymenobacter cellulosivorans]|uniref:Uncharacterized protein n=1 Tax=Hymenobacter cellulosivorans TaxID=2932249 RepID=A0ABY4F8Y8_9BACT|nr:hypothetical protein [Hymenobacter cellulosivorans]UOQ50936.1 hypothetical protein MUN80_14335 [Hymenobacter cellulosivorans]